VLHIDDLFRSASLLERGFFLELPHPAVGRRPLAGVPWVASRSPMAAATAAPCLGQHTAEVLERWLPAN
jgi:crotonobetainyl-CoA:carnitine CoA-transferase CaiB-like acyl-CoA transferase